MKYGNGRNDSFVFYKSYRDIINELPKDEQLGMLRAVLDYGLDGKEPKNFEGYLKAIFLSMKTNIDFSNARYRACVENGKKGATFGKLGGRPNVHKGNPQKPLKVNPQKPLKEFSEKPLTYSSSLSSSSSLSYTPSLTSSYSSSSYDDDVKSIKKGQLPKPTARKDWGGEDWVERILNRFKDLVQNETGHAYIAKENDRETIAKMVAEKGGDQVSARQSLFFVACDNEKNHLQNFNVETFEYNWAYINKDMKVKPKPYGGKPTIIYDAPEDAQEDVQDETDDVAASNMDETEDDVEREIEGG
jgi:hypothetical protein